MKRWIRIARECWDYRLQRYSIVGMVVTIAGLAIGLPDVFQKAISISQNRYFPLIAVAIFVLMQVVLMLQIDMFERDETAKRASDAAAETHRRRVLVGWQMQLVKSQIRHREFRELVERVGRIANEIEQYKRKYERWLGSEAFDTHYRPGDDTIPRLEPRFISEVGLSFSSFKLDVQPPRFDLHEPVISYESTGSRVTTLRYDPMVNQQFRAVLRSNIDRMDRWRTNLEGFRDREEEALMEFDRQIERDLAKIGDSLSVS